MKFIWDENKLKSNLEKHGLDFDVAKEVFHAPEVSVFIDDRFDYGEERRLAYAIVDGIKLCLCYVHKKEEIRVISLRRVHDKEWRKHHGDSYI